MRSCDETLELISAALDGALTEEEQAALEQHLASCPACSALFAELDGLHAAAAQLEEIPAPADFTDQVMARIAADPVQETSANVVPFPAKKRSRTPWKGWAATAAVVAVVVLGVTALPGRSGMGSSMDSTGTGSNNSSRAPAQAQAENANADPSTEADTARFFMYSADENTSDNGGLLGGTDSAAPESAFGDLGAEKASGVDMEMQEMGTCDITVASDQSSPAAYCGVLTLTGEPLPEGLEDYESSADLTGTMTYTVPADYFFSCLTQLEDQNAANFTYEVSEEETAEYGLIIVETP